jgi:hypothetical protein
MSFRPWWPRIAAAALPCYVVAVYWLDRSAVSGRFVDAFLMPGLLAMAYSAPLMKLFGLTVDGWFNVPTAVGSVLLIALYFVIVWLVIRLLIAWR